MRVGTPHRSSPHAAQPRSAVVLHLLSRRSLGLSGAALTLSTVQHGSASALAEPRQWHDRWDVDVDFAPATPSGDSDSQRQAKVRVTARSLAPPSGASALVVWSSGFLTPPEAYGLFLQQLLAAGCAVVTYDKPFESLTQPLDDLDSAALLRRVCGSAVERLRPPASLPRFLAGHSRGAKVSVLAAAAALEATAAAAAAAAAATAPAEGAAAPSAPPSPPSPLLPPPPPLAGLILIDPADGGYERQDPVRFPSAAAALRRARAGLDRVPVLVVGAGRGADCVPRAKNFRLFYDACQGPAALVELQDAGHLQVLDASQSLQQSICAAGKGVSNVGVARASAATALAFIRGVADRRAAAAAAAASAAAVAAAADAAAAAASDCGAATGSTGPRGAGGAGGAAGATRSGAQALCAPPAPVPVPLAFPAAELEAWCRQGMSYSELRFRVQAKD